VHEERTEDNMGETFTQECPRCDAPVVVTPDQETSEHDIYAVTCPFCGESGYVVRIKED
jgi:endogenous inhibitor of DNA gyrase (YacG/DUF329 family)